MPSLASPPPRWKSRLLITSELHAGGHAVHLRMQTQQQTLRGSGDGYCPPQQRRHHWRYRDAHSAGAQCRMHCTRRAVPIKLAEKRVQADARGSVNGRPRHWIYKHVRGEQPRHSSQASYRWLPSSSKGGYDSSFNGSNVIGSTISSSAPPERNITRAAMTASTGLAVASTDADLHPQLCTVAMSYHASLQAHSLQIVLDSQSSPTSWHRTNYFLAKGRQLIVAQVSGPR